jgi:hypothetical protein
MPDRRYNDDEVSVIFAKAAEGPQTPAVQTPNSQGLTLAELQDIGREVGIPADAVAQAARLLEIQPRARARTLLGLPIGVERTIELGRWMSDAEWELLVVRLREEFRARGSVGGSGSFRQWSNGNLQALLEPTPTGHRLRFSTYRRNARVSITAGLATLGVTAALGIVSAASGSFASAATEIVIMSAIGIGMIANGALRLPGWARLRARQFEMVGATTLEAPAPSPPQLPPRPTPRP